MANRLIHEQSQYLLQHANNPVDWYPWGEEAFEIAKARQVPVLVSIGYAACHWCHVMEHESFENADVAAYMNEHFVCIKVDREEHPDVDHMYMDAVQAISGSGGWPLNVFVTPDKIPFYGGTYFPPRSAYGRPSWGQLLQRMSQVWHEERDSVTQQADQMVKHLTQVAQNIAGKDISDWDADLQNHIINSLLAYADKEWGGFGNAPKFPGTMALKYMLAHHNKLANAEALQHVLLSLDAMAYGGIYDHLLGGFARYSTDKRWLAPHFEKMLYDNALLLSVYADAYKLTKDEHYKSVMLQTLAFLRREMKHSDGGFYSALDADSEGIEGKFYTWTWQELNDVLGAQAANFAAYFGAEEHGNWEHTNILHIPKSSWATAKQLHPQWLIEAMEKLIQVRASRIRPLTDDKCLLAWNALLNIAMVDVSNALGDDSLLQEAITHMEWIIATYNAEGKWLHTAKDGIAKITAKLDDMAYLVQAMIQLAITSGEMMYLQQANDICQHIIAHFNHESDCYFYYTSTEQTDIPVRKVDLYDGALPSANSVMAHNLWLLGIFYENADWMYRAEQMVLKMTPSIKRHAYSFSYWSLLALQMQKGAYWLVCSGPDAHVMAKELNSNPLFNTYAILLNVEKIPVPYFKGKYSVDKTHIFVCTENACLMPVSGVAEALNCLKSS